MSGGIPIVYYYFVRSITRFPARIGEFTRIVVGFGMFGSSAYTTRNARILE
jgi:hypothetical protein